jgi:hypothetical protein
MDGRPDCECTAIQKTMKTPHLKLPWRPASPQAPALIKAKWEFSQRTTAMPAMQCRCFSANRPLPPATASIAFSGRSPGWQVLMRPPSRGRGPQWSEIRGGFRGAHPHLLTVAGAAQAFRLPPRLLFPVSPAAQNALRTPEKLS